MRFLDSASALRAVSGVIGDAKWLRAAVAYWGDGATKRFGTANTKDVVIVCDLMSGCCNPKEIKSLQNMYGKECVLTRDRLHAKVWLTDKSAIIGSSNASANGLSEEGNEARALIEANIQVENPDIRQKIRDWFERHVVSGARQIEKDDLKQAKKLWKQQRATRTRRNDGSPTLLEALKKDAAPFEDRNAVVWIYKHTDYSPEARRLFEKEKKRLGSSIGCWEDAPQQPEGSYVLDFDSSGDRPKLDEGKVWQVLNSVTKAKGKGSILLCQPAPKIFGLRLGDRRAWENAAKRAISDERSRDEWDLASFARYFG